MPVAPNSTAWITARDPSLEGDGDRADDRVGAASPARHRHRERPSLPVHVLLVGAAVVRGRAVAEAPVVAGERNVAGRGEPPFLGRAARAARDEARRDANRRCHRRGGRGGGGGNGGGDEGQTGVGVYERPPARAQMIGLGG